LKFGLLLLEEFVHLLVGAAASCSTSSRAAASRPSILAPAHADSTRARSALRAGQGRVSLWRSPPRVFPAPLTFALC
jgi:hypothetical protein